MLILSWSEPGIRPADALRPAERPAYLPAESAWYDFYTGVRMKGGEDVTLPAPVSRMPLLVRAGSIVPLGPDVRWTGEKPADPLELRVYPGADGKFTLYEDSGEGYAYEKGECSRITLAWDDAARTLTVGARQGRFPGMLEARTLRVVVVRPAHGTGFDVAASPDAEVRYGSRR
jgi:alpha-D-xyloside xylohydrolase